MTIDKTSRPVAKITDTFQTGSESHKQRPYSKLALGLFAALLILSACSKRAPTAPTPLGLELHATKTEVVGAGASSIAKADEIAVQVLEPVHRYYNGTLFGVVFPTENFEGAVSEFTPTIAAKALGEHAALMTPAEAASRISGVLEPHDVTATVTLFFPAKASVSHAGVSVALGARGYLEDGTPLDISRQDFFVVEQSSSGWKVISYECRQKIDAPASMQEVVDGGSSGR